MLEGVLKDTQVVYAVYLKISFNPWYVGGGVKSAIKEQIKGKEGVAFQSLVCWRGC